MTQRNLDGCYFQVFRGGKWKNVCFSDLDPEERENVLEHRTTDGLKSLCCHLADRLRAIRDEMDLEYGEWT